MPPRSRKTSKRDPTSNLGFDGLQKNWRRFRYTGVPAYFLQKGKKWAKFFRMQNPSERPRVKRSYRARDNDPTGAKPGHWVERETRKEYDRQVEHYEDMDEEFWGDLAPEMQDRAATVVGQIKSRSGKLALAALDDSFEKVGDIAATVQVKAFVNMEKPSDESVDEH